MTTQDVANAKRDTRSKRRFAFPYGEIWVDEHKSQTDLPFKFTGKELDPETGLYYYGARYYDARLSRWISADPALEDILPADKSNRSRIEETGMLYSTTYISEKDKIRRQFIKSEIDYSLSVKKPEEIEAVGISREENSDDRTASKKSVDKKSKGGIEKIYDPVMLAMYAYTRNNPVRYIDPDGKLEVKLGASKYKVKPDTKFSDKIKEIPNERVRNTLRGPAKKLDKMRSIMLIDPKYVPGELKVDLKTEKDGKSGRESETRIDLEFKINVDW